MNWAEKLQEIANSFLIEGGKDPVLVMKVAVLYILTAVD
jgi:hypothetical protein